MWFLYLVYHPQVLLHVIWHRRLYGSFGRPEANLSSKNFHYRVYQEKKIDVHVQMLASMVLRTDAAWRPGSSSAELEWTITRQKKVLQFAILEQHVFSSLMGENLALRSTLLKCKDLGIRNLKCEAGSSFLINSIKNGNTLLELCGVVADILCTANYFEFIYFGWISRKDNSAIDMLAKHVLNVSSEDFALT